MQKKLVGLKIASSAKKKGNFFQKLGFDFRNQIQYEGDLIDSFKDIEDKIETWSKPFRYILLINL